MEIMSVHHPTVTVIRILDNLDATTSQEATDYMHAEIEAGHKHLIVDLSGVIYLSSAGLRTLLATMQKAQSVGGSVCLAGAEGNIKRVLDIVGLTKVVKTFATDQEAIASYNE
jgi:anti-anti-sigma factor